jgi:hypothetical protein
MRNSQLLFVLFLCGAIFAALAVAAPSPQNPATPQAQPGTAPDQSMSANETLSPESQDKLIREVRHELIMLPYYAYSTISLSASTEGRSH